MIMKYLFFLLILFPLTTIAQKLKLNQYDKFIRQQRLESFPVPLKSGEGMELSLSLHAVGPTFFLHLLGTGSGTNAISSDDEVILELENANTVTMKKPYVMSPGEDQPENAYQLEYELTYQDLQKLSRYTLLSLRKKTANTAIVVQKQHAAMVKDLGLVFVNELNKTSAPLTMAKSASPGFPGGNGVMQNFLNRNLKLQAALPTGEMKTAVVEFVVKADGSVNDLQIRQSAGDSFDSELIRILKRMPKWKPAIENGKLVDAVVTKPVTFYKAATEVRIQL
jgi:TonB family protein